MIWGETDGASDAANHGMDGGGDETNIWIYSKSVCGPIHHPQQGAIKRINLQHKNKDPINYPLFLLITYPQCWIGIRKMIGQVADVFTVLKRNLETGCEVRLTSGTSITVLVITNIWSSPKPKWPAWQSLLYREHNWFHSCDERERETENMKSMPTMMILPKHSCLI